MKAIAEACLTNAYADASSLAAFVSNAGLLLRLAGRHDECETLLKHALPHVGQEPQIRRLLALSQAAQGRRAEGIATLAGDTDPESQLLAAEFTGFDDPAKALAMCTALAESALDARLANMRWSVIGEFAVRLGDKDALQSAISAVRQNDPTDITPDLLEIRAAKSAGAEDEEVRARLRAVVAGLQPAIDMLTRYMLAEQLRREDMPEEAAAVLANYVDLARGGPAPTLYLQALAEARRDDAFRKALAAASASVREDPEVLWIAAAHAWNVGDLAAAFDAVECLLRIDPDNARARLLKIEILIRQDRSTQLYAELDKRLEDLAWTRPKDEYRIAAILGYFGYVDRAGALAYRLFLEHRDDSRAWMTLTSLVLHVGRGANAEQRVWEATAVGRHVAVDLTYDDGERVFLVVEPDAHLRQLDNESWEPEHPLVKSLDGLLKGSRFIAPDGREGTITELRHKYVARFHYVMQRHESRFPQVKAFRTVPVDIKAPDGLAAVIAEIKRRHDWVNQQYEEYRNGPWPLGVLAERVGCDTIEVGAGIVHSGFSLRLRSATSQNARKLNRPFAPMRIKVVCWTCWHSGLHGSWGH